MATEVNTGLAKANSPASEVATVSAEKVMFRPAVAVVRPTALPVTSCPARAPEPVDHQQAVVHRQRQAERCYHIDRVPGHGE
jgi:hypothetical protein